MKTLAIAVISGLSLVAIVLLIAFAYAWMYPEGGDGWDAKYFFTHLAFFIIFAAGFAASISWKVIRSRRISG